MTFLVPGSRFKGRVELAQVPFLESYLKKKNCFIKMPLDLNSFLEVAVADHFLGCHLMGFNLIFFFRWSAWDSTRWYCRSDTYRPLRSL